MPLLPSCSGSCGKLEKLLLPLPGFDRECHSRRTVVFVSHFCQKMKMTNVLVAVVVVDISGPRSR